MHGLLISLALSLAAAEGEEEKVGPWSGNAGISAAWLTGNSNVLELIGVGLVEYNGDTFVMMLELDGAYERSRPEGTGRKQLSAAAVDSTARGEYRFTPNFSVYGLLGGETDRFADLEARIDSEVGLGITAIEHASEGNETLLRFYVGFHYARDFWTDFFPMKEDLPDEHTSGPAARATLRFALSETVAL